MELEPSLSQEKTTSLEAEPEVLAITEKEKEDMQWTVNRKKWPGYWIPRLAEEKENLPEDIKQFVEDVIAKNKIKHKGTKYGELGRYVTKLLDGINKGIPTETIILQEQKERKEKELETVRKETESLNQLMVWSDHVNESMLDQKLLPLLSDQEKRDLAATGKTKGGIKYWLKRISPEVDILPDEIRSVVKEFIKTGETPTDTEKLSKFARYIDRRTSILVFQSEKRASMSKLKETLKAIDQKEDFDEEEQKSRKTCSYENDVLFVEESGEKKPIGLGDIVADLEWGNKI